jgi:cyclic beta-1,2-glucan synthetase
MSWITAHMLRFTDPGRAASPGGSDEPIRAELFSPDRLEMHAQTLAAAQVVAGAGRPSADLSARSRHNVAKLLDCYRLIAEAARHNRAITPAGEWLLDNFHVVDEQGHELGQKLTSRYCGLLPPLADGYLAGYPRAYGVAWAFVAHTDSRFNPELLRRFVRAYQRVEGLAIRELWAIPLLLHCVLLENLRRICVRVAASQEDRLQADAIADGLLGRQAEPAGAARVVPRVLKGRELSTAFAVQLIQRLRYQDVPLQWLNQQIAEAGLDPDAMVQSEHAMQSASNLSVQNIITSMRAIAAFDWPAWFEEVSAVDEVLRAHPGFAAMDFTTRDRYRHALEELALGSARS